MVYGRIVGIKFPFVSLVTRYSTRQRTAPLTRSPASSMYIPTHLYMFSYLGVVGVQPYPGHTPPGHTLPWPQSPWPHSPWPHSPGNAPPGHTSPAHTPTGHTFLLVTLPWPHFPWPLSSWDIMGLQKPSAGSVYQQS